MIDESTDRGSARGRDVSAGLGIAAPVWFEETGVMARRERLTVAVLTGVCLIILTTSWLRVVWEEPVSGATASGATARGAALWDGGSERGGGAAFEKQEGPEEGEPLRPRLGLATLESGGRDSLEKMDDPDSIANGGIDRLDLNRADASQLQSLPGIGPVLAHRILAERVRGPFLSLEDLAERVRGIGPKTVERLRPWTICEPLGVSPAGDAPLRP